MEKKLTKRDYFNQIINLATANDREDIVEFAKHEIELLDKKKSNGKAKVNETMDKNVELVYERLSTYGGKATATELIAKGGLEPLSNDSGVITTQKVASYLNKLVAQGRVNKVVDKKKTYFSVNEN